ncbi:hypothetical protein IMZ68_06865 [Candidatus Bathyarchaeota archaeon]|nr:hypothetical protein [Candidatus Bathyarchaeota archaeon]
MITGARNSGLENFYEEKMSKAKKNLNISHCDSLRTARNIIDDVHRLLWNGSMDHHNALTGSFLLYGIRQSADDLASARNKIQEVLEKLEQVE